MKVKIEYTIEVPDNIRRGMRIRYAEPGLATRQEIKNWYRTYGVSADDDLSWDAQIEEDEFIG